MKLSIIFLGIVLYLNCSQGQTSYNVRGEFATQSNGLMYDEKDMKVLRFIVDSLNLRFRKCEFNKEIYSLPQGWANYVEFSSDNEPLTEILKDVEGRVAFDVLVERYKKHIKKDPEKRLVISYRDPGEKGIVYLSQGTPEEGYFSKGFDVGQLHNDMKGRWLYIYYKKSEYSDHYSLNCWFLADGFIQTKIPTRFSKLLEYVDCMVDTTTIAMLAKGWETEKPKGELMSVKTLRDYIQTKGRIKAKPFEEDYFYNIKPLMTAPEYDYLKNHLSKDKELLRLVNVVADDCIKYRCSDEHMESIVEESISKKKALLMMKSRIVMGQCSQDQRPRLHARQIALFAADSHSWDIFLRAHLDIMNDRFPRMTDNSYAYDARKTYLKELEELNLNIVDLMLGLAMRADNLPTYHYYGTVWRVAWALTESREQDRFRQTVMEMMKDPELDEFNRGLAFMLYSIYLRRHDDKEKALQLTNEFRSMASEFPEGLRPYIASIKDPSKEEE